MKFFNGFVWKKSLNKSFSLKDKIIRTQRAMERSMLNIKLVDHIPSNKIRKMTQLKDAVSFAKQQKWTWAGHLQRRDDNRWAKKIENWIPSGRRGLGRPKVRWKDDIEEHASFLWRRKSQRREAWRNLGKSYVAKD